jgi:hypothetical protein
LLAFDDFFIHQFVIYLKKKEGEKKNNKVTAIAIASFHLTEEGRRKEDEERERRTCVRVCRLFVVLDIFCALISGLFASVLEHIK